MRRVRAWRMAALIGGLAMILAMPASVAAKMDRGTCQATGTATSSGSVDLTTIEEWHMQSTDVAGGTGTAGAKQTSGQVAAYALGIGLPIASASGDGDTEGSVQGVQVATYAILGARFAVSGSSVGEDGGCAGHFTVILDDVNPLLTVLGGGGLVLFLLGLLGMIWTSRKAASAATRIMSAIFGLISGIGLALALEQFGVIDARTYVGLGIAIVLLVVGFILAGRFVAAGDPRMAA